MPPFAVVGSVPADDRSASNSSERTNRPSDGPTIELLVLPPPLLPPPSPRRASPETDASAVEFSVTLYSKSVEMCGQGCGQRRTGQISVVPCSWQLGGPR